MSYWNLSEDDQNLTLSLSQPDYYEIRVKGRLDQGWSDWLDPLTITLTESGETILFGPFLDQSALHGLISCLRNKELVLISVKRVVSKESNS